MLRLLLKFPPLPSPSLPPPSFLSFPPFFLIILLLFPHLTMLGRISKIYILFPLLHPFPTLSQPPLVRRKKKFLIKGKRPASVGKIYT